MVGVLGLLGLGAALLKLHVVAGLSDRQETRAYELGKDLFPLIVAVAATFLASWFQQRATFLESLRRLWSHLIDAKLCLIEYAEGRERSQAQYRSTYRALARAIDEMRGVYRNVGESSKVVGRYPYEPLHDMRRALERVGHGTYDEQASAEAIELIDQAWNALRAEFLAEFIPPEPTAPILEPWSHDPRRPRLRPPPEPTQPAP